MIKDKIVSVQFLLKQMPVLKRKYKTIGFTNGCFDILHKGHVAYLEKSKEKADILIVAVNSDDSVKKLKGDFRPVNRLADRMYVLAALESVDYVVSFDDTTPEKIIRQIQPNVLLKGGDWDKKDIVGGEFVQSCGGSVFVINYVRGYSTTSLIDKIEKT